MREQNTSDSRPSKIGTGKKRRWPWIVTLLAVAIVAGVVIAMIFQGEPPEAVTEHPGEIVEPTSERPQVEAVQAPTRSASSYPSPVFAEVGTEDFMLELGNVRITGDENIVESTSQIKAQLVDAPTGVYAETGGILDSAGIAVEINLTNDEQPQSVVDIAFDLSEVNARFNYDEYPVVMSENLDGSMGYIESTWDPVSKTVTAHAEHFTKFSVMLGDFRKGIDSLSEGVKKTLSFKSVFRQV